jgi:ammonia channel protein AmtB
MPSILRMVCRTTFSVVSCIACDDHLLLLHHAYSSCRVWSDRGWLSPYNPKETFDGVLGYMDYAGSSVVHAMGGMSALIAVAMLGPRYGRFSIDGDVCELQGSVVCSCPPSDKPLRQHGNLFNNL